MIWVRLPADAPRPTPRRPPCSPQPCQPAPTLTTSQSPAIRRTPQRPPSSFLLRTAPPSPTSHAFATRAQPTCLPDSHQPVSSPIDRPGPLVPPPCPSPRADNASRLPASLPKPNRQSVSPPTNPPRPARRPPDHADCPTQVFASPLLPTIRVSSAQRSTALASPTSRPSPGQDTPAPSDIPSRLATRLPRTDLTDFPSRASAFRRTPCRHPSPVRHSPPLPAPTHADSPAQDCSPQPKPRQPVPTALPTSSSARIPRTDYPSPLSSFQLPRASPDLPTARPPPVPSVPTQTEPCRLLAAPRARTPHRTPDLHLTTARLCPAPPQPRAQLPLPYRLPPSSPFRALHREPTSRPFSAQFLPSRADYSGPLGPTLTDMPPQPAPSRPTND